MIILTHYSEWFSRFLVQLVVLGFCAMFFLIDPSKGKFHEYLDLLPSSRYSSQGIFKIGIMHKIIMHEIQPYLC